LALNSWKTMGRRKHPTPEGESPKPMARGGRRYKHPQISEESIKTTLKAGRGMSEASLRNLRSWRKGTSGNPNGKSTALNDVIRLARSHAPECIDKLLEIMRSPDTHPRDAIQAALAILDRGCGKAIVPVFRTGNRLPLEMTVADGEGDGAWTPLLGAAGQGPAGAYRKMLADELARLDAEAAQEKSARRDEVDAAAEAMRRGEEVSPLMSMLVQVRKETS
jgi:hypothetical protein